MSFPSGAWKGYWTQPGSSRFFPMRLSLTFSDGRLTGNGTDEVGAFLVRGAYEGEECWWVKAYVGQHAVDYRGRGAGRSIQGRWEIPGVWGGGFRIWPEGEDALSGEFMLEETVARTAQWSDTPVFTAVLPTGSRSLHQT